METREITPSGIAFNSENNFYEEEAKANESNKKPKFKFLKRNNQKNQRKEKDAKENEEINEEIGNLIEASKEKKEEALEDQKEETSQTKFQFLKRKKNTIVNEKVIHITIYNPKIVIGFHMKKLI